MRVRSQLLLGTSALVLALVGVQSYLQVRQLQALELELAQVATSVGEGLLFGGVDASVISMAELPDRSTGKFIHWVWDDSVASGDEAVDPGTGEGGPQAWVVTDDQSVSTSVDVEVTANASAGDGEDQPSPVTVRRVRRTTASERSQIVLDQVEYVLAHGGGDATGDDGGRQVSPLTVELLVERRQDSNFHELIVRGVPGGERRIEIPVTRSSEVIQSTLHQGLAAGGVLLLAGLCGAAAIAHRVTRPLQGLCKGVEAIGHGELGIQVDTPARGELQELQEAFNVMSSRLQGLEEEKEAWRQREHLAELGELARGLAHTLRNPLNTLGLAVQELSNEELPGRPAMVTTAHAQIRRIDRWLKSFLAVSAGAAADVVECDLLDVVEPVVLESLQSGGRIELKSGGAALPVRIVPAGIAAAVANVVANAVEAAPSQVVQVTMAREAGHAVVAVADRGPGVPAAVRKALFSPHVTTKAGGSGMGLFLARQLVVNAHHGWLEVNERDGGGTEVRLAVPLVDSVGAGSDSAGGDDGE